ncbi:hypothetical protein LINPERPRIM_LOCUS20512 [Linum perenne]
MLLGDHTRTYLHQYTQLIKIQQCTRVINPHYNITIRVRTCTQVNLIPQYNSINGVIIHTIQHLITIHLPTRIAPTFTLQPHNSQFTVSQLPTSTKHNPTNPSSSIHKQVQLHLHPFIWTHAYSTMHTRHINHNHILDKYITTTHSFIYVSSLGAIGVYPYTTPAGQTHPLFQEGPRHILSSRRIQGPNLHRHITTTTIDHATLPGGVTAPHSSRRGDNLGAV